jgi:hypothetical protein
MLFDEKIKPKTLRDPAFSFSSEMLQKGLNEADHLADKVPVSSRPLVKREVFNEETPVKYTLPTTYETDQTPI